MKKSKLKQIIKECILENKQVCTNAPNISDKKQDGGISHEPHMRVRSDEPEPFGYDTGMDINTDIQNEMVLPPGFTTTTIEDLPSIDDDMIKEAVPGREVGDDEFSSYLKRVASKEKSPSDKFKYPFVHRSNIVDENGESLNEEHLKQQIKKRPEKILKQNKKIGKSGGQDYVFYNIGLPALKGLVVDESTNKFKIIDTCPGAGACRVYCYAKRGGYVQFKRASMSQTQLLNFLVNDWQGFKDKLINELKVEYKKYSKKNAKIIVRWHDSGDFFSPDYLRIAYDIAEALPDITFYAYTKMASAAVGNKPKNFVMNFSQGALPEQEKQVDTKQTKHSVVVPKQLADEFSHKEGDEENRKVVWNSPTDLDKFKTKMANKYGIQKDTILTYDELMKLPYDPQTATPKWNAIIVAGDGDDAAMRNDVLGVYLLWH